MFAKADEEDTIIDVRRLSCRYTATMLTYDSELFLKLFRESLTI